MITANLYFTADALDFLTHHNINTEDIICDAMDTCEPFWDSVFEKLEKCYPDKAADILADILGMLDVNKKLLEYVSYNIEDIDIDETETRELHKAGYIGTTAFYLPVEFDDKGFMKGNGMYYGI